MTANRRKIAVVTGANRGIGFEICKQLAQRGLHIILTSRNEKKGLTACDRLKKENAAITYHCLDVSDPVSIRSFSKFIRSELGRCDILVNNAGIFPDAQDASNAERPSVFDTKIETVRKAMETNVYGPMLLCQALVPLMKKHNYGRIVNLSSGMGQLTYMNGYYPAYRLSKASVNALSRIVSEELKDFNILVNSMCPGWVKTDMGGPEATRELSEGADTAVWLSTLPDDGPRGKFFRDRKEIEW